MAGIYIHIPFCKQACYYCNFHFSTTKNYKILIKSIQDEIYLKKFFLNKEKIESIYFGGGTPSLIKSEYIKQIIKTLKTHFEIKNNCEITLEVNPDDINNQKLKIWKKLGINRLSIGIQTFDNAILKSMNRSHNSLLAKKALKKIKTQFSNYSIDLIYGAPKSTIKTLKKDLNIIKDINPPHVSIYNMTVEKNTVFYNLKKLGKLKLPTIASVLKQYQIIHKSMIELKYINYEISNFTKNNFISIHNSNYWKSKKYIGFGPSAHSYDLKYRYWNSSNNQNYINEINKKKLPEKKEKLSKNNIINEHIMTRLRTIWGLNLKEIKEKFQIDLYSIKKNELNLFKKEKHIEIKNNTIILNKKGKIISDYITEKIML